MNSVTLLLQGVELFNVILREPSKVPPLAKRKPVSQELFPKFSLRFACLLGTECPTGFNVRLLWSGGAEGRSVFRSTV